MAKRTRYMKQGTGGRMEEDCRYGSRCWVPDLLPSKIRLILAYPGRDAKSFHLISCGMVC